MPLPVHALLTRSIKYNMQAWGQCGLLGASLNGELMNISFKRFIFVMWIGCSVLSAHSATYFVDFVDGNDSATGTSAGTPFKRCPGDASATGIAAATALNAGDTVKFKGDVVYRGKITLTRSGTAGNPITYDGNSAGDWGVGKAVMNVTNHPTITVAFQSAGNVSNLVIRNFKITEFGGYHVLPAATGCSPSLATPKPGAGIEFGSSYSAMDIVIQDCDFSELGEWHPIDPFEDGAIVGGGVSLHNCHRVTVSGCDFTKMFVGIEIKTAKSGIGTSDIVVTNCNFHNYIAWGIDIAARASGCTLSNVAVINSDFHDYQEFDLGQWAGCGERPHTDGIFIRNVYSSNTWAGWNRIEGCRFYNTNNVGGGSACISITEGPSFDIINNLFMNTVHGRTIYLHNGAHPGDAPQTNNIWNNTFWNDHTAVNLTRGGYDLGWVSIKNNIFYDTRTGSGANYILYSEEAFESCRPDELDYNLYYSFNSGGRVWQASGLGSLTLEDIKTLGLEGNGLRGDPQFLSIAGGVGAGILENDFRLRSTSPAIGKGTNLSRFFQTDLARRSRLTTGGWTIGAWSYDDGRPISPDNLRKIGP